MEDYTALKRSLSKLPAIAVLTDASRIILSKLDDPIALPSARNHLRDYRGFAGLMKLKIKKHVADPTMRILESWGKKRPDVALDHLIECLEAMDRHDIIQDLIPTLSFEVEIVPREDWGARANVKANPIATPVKHIFISHTVTAQCYTKDPFSAQMRSMQDYHIMSKGWGDIAYNFVIGGDGRVYEGVGWNRGGRPTCNWSNKSYDIAFIGDYRTVEPNSNMLRAAILLIARGVEKGFIAKDHWVNGARDARNTLSPGDELYAIIRRWPRFQNDLSVFETSIEKNNKLVNSQISDILQSRYMVIDYGHYRSSPFLIILLMLNIICILFIIVFIMYYR